MSRRPLAPELGGLVEATSLMKKVSVELIARVRTIIRIRLKRLVRIFISLEATIFAVKAYGQNIRCVGLAMKDVSSGESPRLDREAQRAHRQSTLAYFRTDHSPRSFLIYANPERFRTGMWTRFNFYVSPGGATTLPSNI